MTNVREVAMTANASEVAAFLTTSVDGVRSTLQCALSNGYLGDHLANMIEAARQAGASGRKTLYALLHRMIRHVPGHKWRCRMCSCILVKKAAGVPHRRCPNCGCHFTDHTQRWKEVHG